MLSFSRLALLLPWVCAGGLVAAEENGRVLVRHAPSLKGTVEGSVQMMSGENASVEGTARISGDLFVPGLPTLVLKNDIVYGGTVVGVGEVSPAGYTITVNTGGRLGHIVTRTSPLTLAAVLAPKAPGGTRTVTIKKSTDSIGSYATLKNLTLESGVGPFAIPAGSYGAFTAKTNARFVLGVAGAQTPEIYSFQSLGLESGSAVTLLGPVIINVATGIGLSGNLGDPTHASWLTLNLYAGNLTLNGGSNLYGSVNASNAGSLVTIKANALLVGGLRCDRHSIENGGTMRIATVVANEPPSVALVNPVDGTIVGAGATISLEATATDRDGSVSSVAFYNGATLLSESTVAPYQYTWANASAGNYLLTATATDNVGAVTRSSVVTIAVVALPVITSGTTASGQVGATFTYQISATNAPTRFAASGLPPGLSVNSETGVISGIPTTAGTSSVTLDATNLGGTGAATLVLAVAERGSITSPSTAEGRVGVAFSFQVEATNGATGFSAVGLPAGLNIDPLTGLIAGTPAHPAISHVVVTVSGTGGALSAPIELTILATLPYVTDFELIEGYVDGSLNSQLGWVVSPGEASINSADSFTGTRSASVLPGTPPSVITQTFAQDNAAPIVFVDFLGKPVARASAANSTVFSAGPTRFALELTGENGKLYSFHLDDTGRAAWTPTAFSVPLDANNRTLNWTRFTVRADFSRGRWDLYANGQMVAFDLQFADGTSNNRLSEFQVQGDTITESRFDDLYVGETHPLFADLNNNGIDDAWETAHGLSLSSYNRDDSLASNGVTVIQAYVGATDPNDFYAGVPPRLTIISGNSQSAPPGTFNPLPFTVEIRDGNGGVALPNAPVAFTVVTGGGQLNVEGPGDSATSTTMRVNADVTGRAQLYYQQPSAASQQSAIKVTAGLSEVIFNSASTGDTNGALLAAGGDTGIWQDANGPPRLWGANASGQLGDGGFVARSQMKRMAGLTGSFRSVALGLMHGVACDAGGQLITWGDNYFGQLGDGTLIIRRVAAPVAGITHITAVAAGDQHSLALASDGSVLSWGDNRRGQLGDGTRLSRRTPTVIQGLTSIIAISAAGNYSAAIQADGTVWVWGANDFGQMASASPAERTTPTQVGTLSGVAKIVAGRDHVLALTTSGTVMTWGASYAGQLGRELVTGVFAPSPVSGLANIVDIAAGDRHSVALDQSGIVWVWGANDVGQLGDSTLTSKASPVALNLLAIKAIAAGGDHVVAMKMDGSLLAWGANDEGQLGSSATNAFSATSVVVLPPND